jgi:hypothetical protein
MNTGRAQFEALAAKARAHAAENEVKNEVEDKDSDNDSDANFNEFVSFIREKEGSSSE